MRRAIVVETNGLPPGYVPPSAALVPPGTVAGSMAAMTQPEPGPGYERADITPAIDDLTATIQDFKIRCGDESPLMRYPDGRYVLADMYSSLAQLYALLAQAKR